MSDDTISRKATICAMEGRGWYHINKDGRLVHGANSKDDEPLYKAKDVYTVLNTMPSAQPEKRTEERTETHACDLIDRQAAIDAHYEYCNKHPDASFPVWSLKILKELPSAQPERKRGKWIERNPQNSDKCRLIECDQCGFSHIVGFNVPYEHWIENRNFCERCGADMRGKMESDGKDT